MLKPVDEGDDGVGSGENGVRVEVACYWDARDGTDSGKCPQQISTIGQWEAAVTSRGTIFPALYLLLANLFYFTTIYHSAFSLLVGGLYRDRPALLAPDLHI